MDDIESKSNYKRCVRSLCPTLKIPHHFAKELESRIIFVFVVIQIGGAMKIDIISKIRDGNFFRLADSKICASPPLFGFPESTFTGLSHLAFTKPKYQSRPRCSKLSGRFFFFRPTVWLRSGATGISSAHSRSQLFVLIYGWRP